MSILANNIKQLRSQRGMSQAAIAEKLHVSRESFSKYENGRSEPPIDILKRISSFFAVSIDLLVGVDLSKISSDNLLQLEGNRVLLPIQVTEDNDNIIEVVTYSASAGYLSGYADPEFIEQLQTIRLPFLDRGKLRAFPIKGDSMLPLQDGSYVVGKYIENPRHFKDAQTYVVITKDEGIVFKRLFRDKQNPQRVVLYSDNEIYQPYSVPFGDIVEMWEFACSISLKEPNASPPTIDQVIVMLKKIQHLAS